MAKLITLQLEVTDEQHQALVERFIAQANAVTNGDDYEDDDDGAPAGDAGSDGELDDRGVAWHPEFHAKTKNKTQAGAWKKRKGADPKKIEEYEKRFLDGNSNPPPADMPAFLAPQSTPAPMPAAPAMPTMPAATMPPQAEPPKPVSYDDMLAAFKSAIDRVSEATVMAQIGEIYAAAGVSDDVNKLGTDETARRVVVERLNALT